MRSDQPSPGGASRYPDGKEMVNLRSFKAFVELELLDAPLTREVVLTLPDEVEAEGYSIMARVLWKLFDKEMNSKQHSLVRNLHDLKGARNSYAGKLRKHKRRR